jgi:hypothetical protein
MGLMRAEWHRFVRQRIWLGPVNNYVGEDRFGQRYAGPANNSKRGLCHGNFLERDLLGGGRRFRVHGSSKHKPQTQRRRLRLSIHPTPEQAEG